ncbi:unnamed protein product [Microthlaspi erraticum]|uniref:Reverse transcriptase Ty1/copia-type domain-containing protein n=1 Tax=Microthlaspi erraticum TaxID=1685480 RepID=A0A6D2IKW2_9BRAS|nr:unnamed protein product [Microthlaspi erraticum]
MLFLNISHVAALLSVDVPERVLTSVADSVRYVDAVSAPSESCSNKDYYTEPKPDSSKTNVILNLNLIRQKPVSPAVIENVPTLERDDLENIDSDTEILPNPGNLAMALVQFNGDNFDEWAQAVRTALRVKKKFGFVDGSVTEPAKDAADHEDWLSAKSMVTLWILNTVDSKVRRTLANKEDPAELWKEIKERFSEGNGPRIQEIKAELACGLCKCNLNSELEKKREEDRIHQFLLGLDDAIYGGVRTSIISTDPLPNLNQVYSKCNVKEEKLKLTCTNCKKKGHTAETCYQTIGYPEWWGERAGQQGGGRGGGRGMGRGRGMVRANAVIGPNSGDGEISTEAERSGYIGLTNEQWSTLIKLLEEKQGATPRLTGKSFSHDWVIDTGASNHMTGYVDLLNDRKYMLPCGIGLPNGKQSLSREKGTVIFDEDFALKNVLFVPDLRCNLISVSQLIKDLDVVLQIANKGCVIQDRIERRLIGAGELRDGLYFFRRLKNFRALPLNKDGADEMWHQRLGHPSNGVFDLLPIVGKSPYELIYGVPPTYDNLKVFGCLAFAHNQRRGGDKFESRSRRCLFVGYPFDKKGWNLFDLETEEVFVSRDVIFVEDVFPLRHESLAGASNDDSNRPLDFGLFDDDEPEVVESRLDDTHLGKPVDPVTHEENVTAKRIESTDNVQRQEECLEGTHENVTKDSCDDTQPTTENLGRGMRSKKIPSKLNDFVLNTIRETEGVDGEIEISFEESMDEHSFHPISHYLDSKSFSPRHRAFLAALHAETAPIFFKDAVVYKKWREAMLAEIEALDLNGTWDLVELPKGKTAIGCKWVYTIKFRADGTLERYKARLVALGNRQVEGVDYSDTFAPVIKMSTIRLFLEVAAAKQWELHQMDVHNAFLHGDLDEEVYMRLPPGFRVGDKQMVCRLKKSLYGLKQAPRCWFAKLRTALIGYGFKQSYSDYSLFYLRKEGIEIYILVYVDDLVIGGNDSKAIGDFKQYLGECFHMKDLGKLKYFLGIEVARNKDGIFLCQRKYTLDIISDAGCLGSKPATSPIEQQHKLALSDKPFLEDPERYRRLVGRLIYLLATRPDLTYVVHVLSQFMHQPRIDHWETALRVVRYLKGTPGQGVLLKSDSDLRLRGWCDADFSGCRLTRRSLGALFITLGTSPVSWKAKKQDVVSQSSAESEYRSMAKAVGELKWLRDVLIDLGITQTQPMELYCDNQAALYIAANPVFHERTKHVERDCHTVRDSIVDGTIVTKKVDTHDQLADVFTKALGRRDFENIISKLGIYNPYAPT